MNKLFIRLLLIIISIIPVISSCGTNSDSQAIRASEQILKDQLKSPSSYSRSSASILWSGKTKAGTPAYVVKLEFDSQNGFGAMLRQCRTVSFILDGKTMRYRRNAVDACNTDLFSQDQLIKLFSENIIEWGDQQGY